MNEKGISIVAVVLVVTLAAGFGAGYWYAVRGGSPAAKEVRADLREATRINSELTNEIRSSRRTAEAIKKILTEKQKSIARIEATVEGLRSENRILEAEIESRETIIARLDKAIKSGRGITGELADLAREGRAIVRQIRAEAEAR